jgi:outer membrane cobalamin receptor
LYVLSIVLSLLLWSAAPASAKSPEGNRTHVEAPEEERAVWVLSEEALDEAGTDAREALLRLPGLYVRSLGDSFALSTLQVRGAAPQHTRVFLDEIPMSRADGAPVDLSLLPLWHSRRIRVWPGHAPLGYGGGLGGALAVDSKLGGPGAYEVRLQTASFSRWSAGLFTQAATDSTEAGLGLRTESSRGGFPWFDNNRTSYDASDDRWRERSNNDARRHTALVRVSREVGSCTGSVVAHGLDQDQGVPGPAGRLAQEARYGLRSGLGAVDVRCSGERWRTSIQAGLGWMRSLATDELAEVSLQPTRAAREAWSPSIRALGWWRPGARVDVGLHQEVVHQRYRLEDQLPSEVISETSRLRTGTGLGARWRVPWASLVVSSRLRLDTMTDDGGERRVAPGWQLTLGSGAWRSHGLSLQLGVSTATRFPSLYEIRGDGLFVSAADGLRDERGTVVSGTARWEAKRLPSAWRLFAALSLFGSDLVDVIQMRRNSLYTAVAQNVGRATLWGAETALGADLFGHLRLDLSATGLGSVMESDEQAMDGERLPLRPESSVYGRLTGYMNRVDGDELAGFVDVTQRGAHTYDLAGLATAPAVTEWGLGARVALGTGAFFGSAGGLTLDARVLNASDAPSVDLLGYPRPGRRWAVQLAWREDGL